MPSQDGTTLLPHRLRRSLHRKIVLSYLVDLLVIAVCFIPALLAPFIRPNQRPININEPSIAFPYADPDTFPSWSLPLICFGLPVVVVVGRMALERFRRPRLLLAILGALLSIALTDLTTNIIKNMVGRLRPDFLARCLPEVTETGKVVCRQTRRWFLEEGRRSFPSGHASTSFAGLSFISLFLAGQMHIFDGEAVALKIAGAFAPSLLALVVSVSRYIDHRHHALDVAFGAALGIGMTVLVYPLYFPLPFMKDCHEPFTTRIERLRAEVLQEQPLTPPSCP